MKIAIVGLGAAGAAALLEATVKGCEAVGFEQFQIGHDRGSSHGSSRLIRRTYPDVFHTRWMARAYDAWDRVEASTGEKLFIRCGGLTFGPEDDGTLSETRQALASCGIDHEMLGQEEVAERFPAINIGHGAIAIHQHNSGFLRADRCVRSQIATAQSLGALVHEQQPVTAIEDNSGEVFVSTAHGTERFDTVIITAGPWIGKLLPSLKLPVRTVLRQTLYLAADGERFTPGNFPVWIHHPSDHYGFPSDGIVPGIKVASHHGGPDFDPVSADRPPMGELAGQVRDHSMLHIRGLSGEILTTKACLYTLTPDERFILDFLPSSRRVIVCSGCSGHGFKFSALLGELAVEMTRSQRRPEDSEPWSLGRFGTSSSGG